MPAIDAQINIMGEAIFDGEDTFIRNLLYSFSSLEVIYAIWRHISING